MERAIQMQFNTEPQAANDLAVLRKAREYDRMVEDPMLLANLANAHSRACQAGRVNAQGRKRRRRRDYLQGFATGAFTGALAVILLCVILAL